MPGGQWADRNAVQSQFVDQAWAYCHRIRKPQIWPTQDKLTPLQQQLWQLPDSSAAAFAMLHMLHEYPWWKQPENAGPSSQHANVPSVHSPPIFKARSILLSSGFIFE